MPDPARPRRLAGKLAVLAAMALTVADCALLSVWVQRHLNGPSLARFITGYQNPRIRGRLEVDSITWSSRAAVDLVRGRPHPVEIDGVRIHDGDGALVLAVPHATVSVDLKQLVRGRVMLYDLRAAEGLVVIAEKQLPGGKTELGLVAAFAPKLSSPSAGRPGGLQQAAAGPVILVRNADLSGIALILEFPGAAPDSGWSAKLVGIHAGADLRFDGRARPPKVDLAFTGRDVRAIGGSLRIGATTRPLESLEARLLAMRQGRNGDLELDAHARLDGGDVHVAGWLTRVFYPDSGVDLALQLTNGGGPLRMALGPIFGGPASADVTVRGQLAAGPSVDGHLAGVTAVIGPLKGTSLGARLHVDPARFDLEDIRGALADGTLRGQFRMDFKAGSWSARATLDALDSVQLTGDPSLARLLGGRLSGSARAGAPMTGPLAVRIDDVDLTLRRTGRAPLPQKLRLRGGATVRDAVVDLRALELSAAGATVSARGRVLTKRRELDLALTVAATRVRTLLAELRVPPIVGAVAATARVTGHFDRPNADGEITVQDVGPERRTLDRVTARLRMRDGTLGFEELQATGFGGTATGRASLKLFAGTFARPLRDPLLAAALNVRHMKVERLAGLRDLTGSLDGEVAIDGPISSPVGHATLASANLAAFGDPYTEAAVDLSVAHRVVSAKRVTLRRAAGGALEAKGDVSFGGALDLDVAATKFPLGAIPRLNELPVPIDGQLSGQLHVGGDVTLPSVGGYVALMATRVRNILFGNGSLKLEPGGDAIRLSGTFFDRLKVDGYLTVAPRVVLSVRIAFEHMALESLVPELSLIDIKGTISGAVQLTINGDGLADAQVRLTELAILFEPGKLETEEERRRFEIRNKYPIRLTYVDGRVTFEHLHLVSAAGELQVTGALATKDSDARIKGKVSLELLEYFTRNLLDHVHGDVAVDLRLRGALARPRLTGSLDLNQATITPHEADRAISVPRAHLEIAPDALTARDVVVGLDGVSVTVNGRLGLDEFKPTEVAATVRGEVSARALQYALPRYFSESAGVIALKLDVNGPVRDPRIGGRVGLTNVDVLVRDLGREVLVRSGTIDLAGTRSLSDAFATIKALRGSLDEGEFTLDGSAGLAAWQLAELDVHFQGMGIPNRVPRVYELSVNTDLRLRLDDRRRLRLEGNVDVVDGRYVQRFDLLTGVLQPARVSVETKPFWHGVPLLASMQLALQVRTAGSVFVRNNLADMTLEMALEVGGTLEHTKVAGEIRTTEGTFAIPFLRGRFTLQEGGTVTFEKSKQIPKETPQVNIIGETVYTDSREQEHLITLILRGPLGQLNFDLTSNTGLNKAQCLALLTTGRTTDEMRAMVTGRPESGQSGGPAAIGAADQALKTISAEFMSTLIEDPLKHTLRLDMARLEFGTESIEVKLGWRIGRHLRLLGSHELGLLGDSHTDGRAEVKLSDYVLVIPEVERLVKGQQTEQETILRGKAQLKLRLIMR